MMPAVSEGGRKSLPASPWTGCPRTSIPRTPTGDSTWCPIRRLKRP